jgi:ankyrin repeat protein
MPFQLSAIDNDELIHEAVRLGHVISLEIYLNQNPKCVNKLYTCNQSKWTPLLAACYYKHEHVVRMLLNRYKPDIEAVGDVVINSTDDPLDLYEEVSPLWIAAVVNHFDIIKLLVEHGNANTNHLTKTHSTPLRPACYNNNLEMVQYLIEHGANPYQMKIGNYTNLMLCADRRHSLLVNYLVNEIKCNVNEQDENGQTALYCAVRSGSVEITKFLLENGAVNVRDNRRKVTPLLRAALYGEISLVDTFEGYCSDLEWIEAKELLATSFSGCISRIENLNTTLKYLTEAFQLRLAKNLPKQITAEPLEVFNYHRECETLEQVNQLFCSNTKDTLHIEMILIHQRLLDDDQNDYHDVIHQYGTALADNRQYHNCLRLWLYEFDLKPKMNTIFDKKYLHQFIYLLIQMKFNDQVSIPIDVLLRIFKLTDNAPISDRKSKTFDFNLCILLNLITIVTRIMYSENIEEKQELSVDHCRDLLNSIRRVIRQQYKTAKTGSSLLHLCTSSSSTSVSRNFE